MVDKSSDYSLKRPDIYITSVEQLRDEKFFGTAYKAVSGERRTKADKLKFFDDKCRCIAAGLLLNYGLRMRHTDRLNTENSLDKHNRKQEEVIAVDLKEAVRDYDSSYDYKVSVTEKGKPYFTDYPDIHYSVTHSKSSAACALFDKPVGIDMEGRRANSGSVAKRFFSDHENIWIEDGASQEERDRRFLRLWTLKEAYSKMTGEGIAACLNKIYFKPEGNSLVVDCDTVKLIPMDNLRLGIIEYETDGEQISVIYKKY